MDAPGPAGNPEPPGGWARPLRRNFAPADLKPHLDAHGIDATLVVQTLSSLDQTRELLDLARSTGWIAGVVGWADLADPALADTLAGLGRRPGGDRLAGIRHQVQDEPDARWLLRPQVLRGLGAVADADLAYDLLVREAQMEAALGAVRAVPSGRFVVDHLGKPDMASGDRSRRGRDAWCQGIAALAAEPHVSCKLSGMVTEADWAGWTVADLLPYAAHVLECFGPDRVMFGSDWPVCTLAAEYDAVFAAAVALVTRCGIGPGSAGFEAVFGGTARRVYLGERGRSPVAE
jgi:L-fuconolactonase